MSITLVYYILIRLFLNLLAPNLPAVPGVPLCNTVYFYTQNRSHGHRTKANHEGANDYTTVALVQPANGSAKEYAELQKKPLEGMKISLPSEADMHQWQILIDGPKGSPYEVGNCQL